MGSFSYAWMRYLELPIRYTVVRVQTGEPRSRAPPAKLEHVPTPCAIVKPIDGLEWFIRI